VVCSIWLAFAFIATSIAAMVRPQTKSARPRRGAFGASAGPMKLIRKPAPPTATVRFSPSRRMICGTVRKPIMVPAGRPNRQKASVSTSRSSAALTSGMRGNQTARPTAFSANTICRARSGVRSEDMGSVPVGKGERAPVSCPESGVASSGGGSGLAGGCGSG
jgi:hypothetical protein